MSKGRMEAFSDGVIAILITIMVLELKAPHGSELSALRSLLSPLSSYLLSFVFLGIYWNNHHHLLQAVGHVSGSALWANLHLLFWLSLVPLVTHWMGENFGAVPVALYGTVLLLSGVAYFVLERALLAHHSQDSALARAVGDDFKGKLSIAIYLLGIALAFVLPELACGLYVLVAILWLVPDRRIERALAETRDSSGARQV